MKHYFTTIKDLIIFEPTTLNDKIGQFMRVMFKNTLIMLLEEK